MNDKTRKTTKNKQTNKDRWVLTSKAGAVQEAHLLLVLAVVSWASPAVLEGADQLNMMDSGSWFAI